MPELPEVETIRLQLSQLIVGLTIKDIEILHKKSFVGDKNLVIGAKIKDIRRFAKILIFDLSNDLSIAIHLKLSGQLIYRGKNIEKKLNITDPLLTTLPNKHTRVIIDFTNGDHLYFNDLRIFGWIKIVQSSKIKDQKYNSKLIMSSIDDLIKNLGPEPLKDLNLEKFKTILASSKKPVKLVLMDQEKLSGVGNIYANDALFLAKIDPKTPSNSLSREKANLLFHKLLKVLKDAIRWGGASEDNYRDAYGEKGEVQEHFYVYQKDGEECSNNCGEKIKRMSLGGRGTFFCPKCQK